MKGIRSVKRSKTPDIAIEAYIAELTAAFKRRRCDTCGGHDVRVICVGLDPAPDVNRCLDCAPWLVRPAVRSVDKTVDRATA